MKQVMRDAALRALMTGGSYRDALETEGVLAALDDIPEIHLVVPIRFRKRYEDMRNAQDHSDSDSEGDEGTR